MDMEVPRSGRINTETIAAGRKKSTAIFLPNEMQTCSGLPS